MSSITLDIYSKIFSMTFPLARKFKYVVDEKKPLKFYLRATVVPRHGDLRFRVQVEQFEGKKVINCWQVVLNNKIEAIKCYINMYNKMDEFATIVSKNTTGHQSDILVTLDEKKV